MIAEIAARLRAAGCVFAEDEAELLLAAAGGPAELETMVKRRVDGLPLEHVVGFAEFCGLRVLVDPGVFVPRRRSEFLVERAAAVTPRLGVAVDLCCGSGALGLALAASAELSELHCADVDPAAVRCARRNVAAVLQAIPPDSAKPPAVPIPSTPLAPTTPPALAVSSAPPTPVTSLTPLAPVTSPTPPTLRVYLGDLYEPLPGSLRGRVDVLLANVPYVPTGEVPFLPAEARDYEAGVALDGGADGLDVLRRVAAGAPFWLAPGGHLLIETSERQAAAAEAVFASAGLRPLVVRSDELGATVVIGAYVSQ